MISRCNYEYLKNIYGKYSSWAIWKLPSDATSKAQIDDLSIFDDEHICEQLNNKYVFVGLNASEQQTTNAKWRCFHSDDINKQNDYKLRYALKDTKFWGSYITDIIKDFKLTKSEKVEKHIKNNHIFMQKNVDMFLDEIKHIGESPIIVAMGNAVYKILKKIPELKNYKILKIMHYSYRYNGYAHNPIKYREKLTEQLKNI